MKFNTEKEMEVSLCMHAILLQRLDASTAYSTVKVDEFSIRSTQGIQAHVRQKFSIILCKCKEASFTTNNRFITSFPLLSYGV